MAYLIENRLRPVGIMAVGPGAVGAGAVPAMKMKSDPLLALKFRVVAREEVVVVSVSGRGVRWVGRAVAVLAFVVLLAGCLGSSTGSNGGTGYGVDGGPSDSSGNRNDGDDALGGSYSDSGSVAGSGRLTSRLIDLSGVTSVVAGADFVVRVTVGQPEQATVQMDDNLTDLVEATVSGSELRLGLKPDANVRNATLTAEVTVGSLDRLSAAGASQVTLVTPVMGPALQLVVSGASGVTGPVGVDRVEAAVSGASTLALSGQVRDLQLSGVGASRLQLADLAVRNLDVVLSGASNATVAVSDTLSAEAAGASALRYRGTPNITRQQTSGASSIVRE
ncbi:MAG: head GIN domain-containing protein [Pseudonocardiaceae bacterium]